MFATTGGRLEYNNLRTKVFLRLQSGSSVVYELYEHAAKAR